MAILLTGATGYLGSHIMAALTAAGHHVIATSRHKPEADNWRRVDFANATDPADWKDIVHDIDIVINAVGIIRQTKTQSFYNLHTAAPIALFTAAQKAGVKRIIQISAIGADENASTLYHTSKKAGDDGLALLDVDWVILRPSLVVGENGQSWQMFKTLAASPIIPIIGHGNQQLQPLPINELCRAVIAVITSPKAVGQRINLVGADTLGLKSYLLTIAHWLGRKSPRTFHITLIAMRAIAFFGQHLTLMPLTPDAITMLEQSRQYDVAPIKKHLGFTPQGIVSWLEQNPPTTGENLQAKMELLAPLLRITLAIMWLVTGIVSLLPATRDQNLTLLASLGLTGSLGTLGLYAASAIDFSFGVALLAKFKIKPLALMQITLISFYTVALTITAPQMWLDPFGPLLKNLPIIAATLVLASLEE